MPTNNRLPISTILHFSFFLAKITAIKQPHAEKVNPEVSARVLFRPGVKSRKETTAVSKLSYGDVFDLANSFARHSKNLSRFFQRMIRLFSDAKSHADYLFLSGTESRHDSL